MASLKFSDLLTKISYVYKSDFYIYHNRYLISGEESDQENVATYICDLSDESISLIKEQELDLGDIVYIQNGKKYKQEDYNKDYVSVIKLDQKKKEVESTLQMVMDVVLKVKDWEPLPITEEDALNMIDKGHILTLFENRTDIPNVTIGKDLFPMISKKNWSEIFYHVKPAKTENMLNHLYLRFNTPYFTLYSFIRYMTI